MFGFQKFILKKLQYRVPTGDIETDEMALMLSKVIPCKKCKIMPEIQFNGLLNAKITCPKCDKSVEGHIDPLDDVKEWNKINKKRKYKRFHNGINRRKA